MKKYLKKINYLLLLALLLPIRLSAQIMDLTDTTAQSGGYSTGIDKTTGVTYVIGLVARAAISLLGVAFMAYVIYGGFLWLTAAGKDEQIEKAKKIIQEGIIGLIVALSAASIYWFVTGTLVGINQTGSGNAAS